MKKNNDNLVQIDKNVLFEIKDLLDDLDFATAHEMIDDLCKKIKKDKRTK